MLHVPGRSQFQLLAQYEVARVFVVVVVQLPWDRVWKWARAEGVVFWAFAVLFLVAMFRFLDPIVYLLFEYCITLHELEVWPGDVLSSTSGAFFPGKHHIIRCIIEAMNVVYLMLDYGRIIYESADHRCYRSIGRAPY